MNAEIEIDENALNEAAWELYDILLPRFANPSFRTWLLDNAKPITRAIVRTYLVAVLRNNAIGNPEHK